MTERLRLSRNHHAIIDAEDLPHVSLYTWRLHIPSPSRTRTTRYAIARIEHKNVYLHLFLWQLWGNPSVPIVDHEDGDGLHCTRQNLRAATVTQNNRNRGALRTNTTGAKGVTWNKKTARYRAKIQVDGKRLHLGYFKELADASRAYDDAATKHHGAYAVLNGGKDANSNGRKRAPHRVQPQRARAAQRDATKVRRAVG